MNVTFLIGNGFDLACGLKSKYLDSYDGYTTSASSSVAVEKFKKSIERNNLTWADFEMQLAKYASEFETEEELLMCLRDYNAYLNDYLYLEQLRFWNNHKDVIVQKNAVLYEVGRSLTQFYYGLTNNDVNDISSIINSDGKVDYSFISFNYTDILDRLVKGAYDLGYLSSSDSSLVISISEVIHIHGMLRRDMVMGIDNERQLSSHSYKITRRARRSLIKPVFLQSYDQSRLDNAINIIEKSNIICIFGLSLGDSDLTWRKLLAQWLKSNRDHHLVYYNHSNMIKTYHSSAITKKMDDEEDGKEDFFSLLYNETIEEEKESILNRIHIPVGMKLFNIDDALFEQAKIDQKKNEMRAKLYSG